MSGEAMESLPDHDGAVCEAADAVPRPAPAGLIETALRRDQALRGSPNRSSLQRSLAPCEFCLPSAKTPSSSPVKRALTV